MHRIPKPPVIKVSDRGCGVMSHVGSRLLADLADRSGVTGGFGEVPDGLRERRSGHPPKGGTIVGPLA